MKVKFHGLDVSITEIQKDELHTSFNIVINSKDGRTFWHDGNGSAKYVYPEQVLTGSKTILQMVHKELDVLYKVYGLQQWPA